MKNIASKLLDNATSLIDSIIKTHKLVDHAENQIAALISEGNCDPILESV